MQVQVQVWLPRQLYLYNSCRDRDRDGGRNEVIDSNVLHFHDHRGFHLHFIASQISDGVGRGESRDSRDRNWLQEKEVMKYYKASGRLIVSN